MDQTTGSNKMTVGASSTPARSKPAISGDRSIEEIRSNIEQTRNEITNTVDKLGERLKETVDWRSYVTEHPFVAVGGAALIGFYLTRKLLTPKRSPSDELLQSLIRAGRDAIAPKRPGLLLTVATLAGKYALDQFQKYEAEQEQQRQQQEQLEAFQAYQQMLQNQMSSEVPTGNQLPERHRVAGSDN
jgi:ElaB/YqjD/DUF883 family membrane-anchored ribosome-binding protein